MNTTEIKALLEKYYSGETSLAEEKLLKDFFSASDIPPELAGHAAQFRYFSLAAEETIRDPEFDDRFLSEFTGQPVIPFYTRRRKLYFVTTIAASFLLLAGLIYTFRTDIFKGADTKMKDTYSDPGIAFKEAQKALLLVSVNLNIGFEQARKIRKFQHGIEKMENFSQFYKYQTIIINPDDQKDRP